MSDEKKVSLEEHFERLDEIITQMEDSSIGIDKSFELYKNGLDQVKSANEMLDSIEKAMLVQNENGNQEEF